MKTYSTSSHGWPKDLFGDISQYAPQNKRKRTIPPTSVNAQIESNEVDVNIQSQAEQEQSVDMQRRSDEKKLQSIISSFDDNNEIQRIASYITQIEDKILANETTIDKKTFHSLQFSKQVLYNKLVSKHYPNSFTTDQVAKLYSHKTGKEPLMEKNNPYKTP